MNEMLYKLDVFEGPLDLMLHLISKNKLDIKDIKISVLLDQYVNHINSMKECGIYIRSEFLNMISRLIYIKTSSLLPKSEENQDLRKQFTEELIVHQELKLISKLISDNISFDVFTRGPEAIKLSTKFDIKIDASVFISLYTKAFNSTERIIRKTDEKLPQIISKRIVSVYSMIIFVLRKLKKTDYCIYFSLFNDLEDRSSIIALFLAILELIKGKRIFFETLDNDIIIKLNRSNSRQKMVSKNNNKNI